jgi:hypothetical protein
MTLDADTELLILRGSTRKGRRNTILDPAKKRGEMLLRFSDMRDKDAMDRLCGRLGISLNAGNNLAIKQFLQRHDALPED